MTSSIDVIGLTSEVLVWQALVLTFISFAVGLLGGFVGLALGTMRLPVAAAHGCRRVDSRRDQHPRQQP